MAKYSANKRPGYPLNQSRTFIQEMQSGDFVVIPAVDDKPVMFGQLLNYYEEANLTYVEEINFLNSLPPYGESADCPYKKTLEGEMAKGADVLKRLVHILEDYLHHLMD